MPQVVHPTTALRELIQFSGSSTPLLRNLERDAFLDDQLRELRTDPHAFRYYLEAAHRYVESDSALLALHNLFDSRLRRMLRDIALNRARRTPSIESANDLLILARTERYLSSDNPDFSFYAEAGNVLSQTFSSFAALLKYREFEQRLRISPTTANVDILLEAADQLRFSGELNGYYDCICRLATSQAFLGNIDNAKGMLLSALQNLLSHGYITDPAIRRSVADPHSGQIAWIYRALSRTDIQKAELEDRAGPKLAALNNALAWNQSAYWMYKTLGIQHGVANVFRERGEIEQQRENLGEIIYPESWLWFLRAVEHYKAVGDPHHEAECRQLATTAIKNLISSHGFIAPGFEEILEKSLKSDVASGLSFDERPPLRGYTKISYSRGNAVEESPRFDQIYEPYHTNEVMEDTENENLSELIALVRNIPRERRPALKQLITAFASTKDDAGPVSSGQLAITEHQESGTKASPQVKQARELTRLGILNLEFEERLETLELPPNGFTSKAQADAAARLGTTLRELQKLQKKLGLPITATPESARTGKAMASAYYRSHDKETGDAIPSRPRGRPRRTEAQLDVGEADESPTAGLTSEMVRTAQEVFGASAKIPVRQYHKSRGGPEFSDDQLKSRDLLSVADAICNQMKAQKALTPEEREMWNRAKRFTYHARKRQLDLGSGPCSAASEATMPDKTLKRRRERYEARLESVDFPQAGETISEENARDAGNLATAFRRLRERQIERGLEPEPKNERVAQAESIVQAFYKGDKIARPPKPTAGRRGRSPSP